MKAAYCQKGETLDYKNSTNKKIEAGDVVMLGDRIGVAGTDIEKGEVGSVSMEGAFRIPKADKEAVALGTSVYLADAGITVSAKTGEGGDASDNRKAGFAAEDSAADSADILVKINA